MATSSRNRTFCRSVRVWQSRWLAGCMGFVWVHVGSFLHRVASPFHSCVTTLLTSVASLFCNYLTSVACLSQLLPGCRPHYTSTGHGELAPLLCCSKLCILLDRCVDVCTALLVVVRVARMPQATRVQRPAAAAGHIYTGVPHNFSTLRLNLNARHFTSTRPCFSLVASSRTLPA